MIRVRIPPSPTGLLHIGTVRTALYNYLFSRKNGGEMIFRIEDTDKERSKKEYEENIVVGLVKLGIAGDEGVHAGGNFGPYRQSERTEIYQKYLVQLLDEDKAYHCFCTKERLEEMKQEQAEKKLPPRYDGRCADLGLTERKTRIKQGERAVIRLRLHHHQEIKFNDLVRGEIKFHTKELDDFVIARDIDDPLYQFTVVVDDYTMQISHVIRGEDHLSNTPKQILIFHAFGWPVPEFAHLPLILNEDKSKLSKRKNKVSVEDYLEMGYLPEALLNFLALIGWNPGESTQEIFTMKELVEKFSLDHVHKGGAVFDIKKLDWINGEYIKKMIKEDINEFYSRAHPFLEGKISTEDPLLIKRMLMDPDFEGRFKTLAEIPQGLAPLFEALPDYEAELLMNVKFGITPEVLRPVFTHAKEKVKNLEWEKGDVSKGQMISETFMGLVTELGLKNGQVLWPIRVALSGLEKSPNFATLAVYLGKNEVLKRLDKALGKLE